jgi:predicted glycosyltransferase
MTTVIKCCIILHNTIVEIERSLPDSEELIQDILNEHDSNEDNWKAEDLFKPIDHNFDNVWHPCWHTMH